MKLLYALLCIAGTVLPLWKFVPWVAANGLALPLFMQQAFGSPIAAFAWLDVVVSAGAVLALVFAEGRRLRMRHLWAPVAGLFAVGVSLALPLFLLLREIHISRITPHNPIEPTPEGAA